MDAGDLIDLEITGVAHGGVFVGRHEGRVVFVPDAIDGETVRVRLTDVGKASFWRGETLEILSASPHRRPHVWRQADVDVPPDRRPGGADFGHIDLAHQRTLKAQVLTDALRRIGGLDLPVPAVRQAGPLLGRDGHIVAEETADGTRWRTRVGLHIDAEGRVGPFAARSHTVVPVEDYPLATAAVERVALNQSGGRLGRIDLVEAADGKVRSISRPNSSSAAPESREVITESVGMRQFRMDAGGFWQVHRLAAPTLDAAVRDALQRVAPDGYSLDPEGWHLDLYGGVGLFAAALASLGGARVTSIESDLRATLHAGANLAEWGEARAETARVDRFISQLAAAASTSERSRLARGVVVLDPPRAGARADVVRGITSLRPSAIVYVACDPVALARDVASFRAQGYHLNHIVAFDLFPNSHHLEAVASFERAPRAGG